MRVVQILMVGMLLAGGTGCFSARPSAPDSFVHQAARNSVQQSIRPHDDQKFIALVRRHAEASFAQLGEVELSKPFHDGYVEGYIDYVEAGGNGEPPYLPPFRYRLTQHRTPEGVAGIQDWYAGFRQGSAVARGSGLRELNIVPLPGPSAPADGLPAFAVTTPPEVTIVQPFVIDRPQPVKPETLPKPNVPRKELGPVPRLAPEVPKVRPASIPGPRLISIPER